ncbi:DUF1186 domain-containing protein [uncultured Endozoicomonas sp.]|uniref:DUF1186 domain-containing protein n=1 Tax=uncultured Endozoicomonas sp. TaxID=432652 RepID=UPI00260F5F59|nr:DUF1186 domain-containing protein [uncultured Endozoicomonas sp.]
MNTEDIISALSSFEVGKLPKAALQAAVANQDAVTPILLDHLKETIALGDDLPKHHNTTLLFFSAYLLAQFREPKALPLMVELVSASPKTVSRLLGYVISESLGRMLASIMSNAEVDAIETLQPLIENDHTHPQVRNAALGALVTHAAYGQITDVALMDYFESLYQGKLERKQNAVWDGLIFNTMVAGLVELEADVLSVHQEGLMVETMLDEDGIKTMLQAHPGEIKAPSYKNLTYIDDCVSELENWAAFMSTPEKAVQPQVAASVATRSGEVQHVNRPWPAKKPVKSKRPIGQKQALFKPPMTPSKEPLVRNGAKVGRNDPCLCGSGKKFKKCCG